MDVPPKYSSPKAEGWLLLAGAAVLMLVLFVKLFFTLYPTLTRANEALKTGRSIKLEAGIKKLLLPLIIPPIPTCNPDLKLNRITELIGC